MKLFWFVFITGLITLLLILKAFKVSIFSLEMFTHSLFHFFIGFAGMGYFFFHRTLKVMKLVGLFVLALLILDQVVDYIRGVGHLNVKFLIFNFYLVLWGGISGFSFARMRVLKKP